MVKLVCLSLFYLKVRRFPFPPDGTPSIKLFSYEEKVNSNSSTTLMCAVVGNPIPDSNSVNIYDSNNTAVRKTGGSTIARRYTREKEYKVIVVEPGENFTCVLDLEDGSTIKKVFWVDVYSEYPI